MLLLDAGGGLRSTHCSPLLAPAPGQCLRPLPPPSSWSSLRLIRLPPAAPPHPPASSHSPSCSLGFLLSLHLLIRLPPAASGRAATCGQPPVVLWAPDCHAERGGGICVGYIGGSGSLHCLGLSLWGPGRGAWPRLGARVCLAASSMHCSQFCAWTCRSSATFLALLGRRR